MSQTLALISGSSLDVAYFTLPPTVSKRNIEVPPTMNPKHPFLSVKSLKKHQTSILAFLSFCLLSTCMLSACGLHRSPATNLQSSEADSGKQMNQGSAAASAPLMRDSLASPMVSDYESDSKATGGKVSSPASAYGVQPTVIFKPQIIKTANVTLKVDNIVTTMNDLQHLTAGYQGIITNQYLSVAQENSTYRQGSLEVRLPEADLEHFLNGISGMGKLLNQQITGTDVGAEIVDTESRVRNLKAEEAALQGIMKRAGKVSEILEVSNELSRVRGDIEQAQGRVAYLKQQVAYSTVKITLSETTLTTPGDTKPSVGTLLSNTFRQAANALEDLFRHLLQVGIWFIVYLLPILAMLGTIAWGGIRMMTFAWRRLRKGTKASNPNTTDSNTPPPAA